MIVRAESTDLFVGPAEAPRQVLRVTLDRASTAGTVTVAGPGIAGTAAVPDPVDGEGGGGGEVTVEVGLEVVGARPGEVLPVTVTAADTSLAATLTVERPGYTMHLISHFHYDPVWWNTQAAYTTPWEWLADDGATRPLFENNAFALVDAHLDLALRDPDYRFVLAEIDYLKPYFDVHPHRRAELRQLVAQGRLELMGGTYNEPNTNLTGAETTIRNIVYGIGYQRDILGGDPRTAWQLDAFGHDPQFPGYLAEAGLTGSAWARGPFHQWGPVLKNFGPAHGDATVMQFPSEFEWIAPSGSGVLTHYMPNHYSAGWWMDSAPTLAEAERAVYELYRVLKPVAATRHLLLPVGTDYTPPNRWLTAIHRSWNARYVWPRFVCSIPRDFLDAVRAELAETGRRPSPQSRDMNPIYTGKDVSYIDTKQAHRAGEVAATDAEKLATIAALLGLGRYPQAALDKVWRQLMFNAHHDAITGSESDQVYIDLLDGWREAHDLAADVRDRSAAALIERVDTTGPGRAVVVANTLSFDRTDLVHVPVDGPARLLDDGGAEVPAVYDGGRLTFRATAVPALGWRTYRLVDGATPEWVESEGLTIANERFRVAADPGRGGALVSIEDLAQGRELIRGAGNELRVYDEYPTHPDFGEGPWHLLPNGTVTGSSDTPAGLRRLVSPAGERLVASGSVGGFDYEQTVTLWRGIDRVDFRTRVVDYRGQDKLLRVRFPVDLPGALPVCEVAAAVVGRGFALPDVDVATAPWTLDNPANTWFGLGSTARVRLSSPEGTPLGERAIGVAEIIVSTVDDEADVRDLVVALARAGVTATTSSAGGSRYGWLGVDSNLPDVRVVLGGPDANPVTRELLERAGDGYAEALVRHGAVWVPADRPLGEAWRPNADLRDLRAVPALVVTGPLRRLVADLADACVEAVALRPPAEPLTDGTVALLTNGLPGFAVDPGGALHLSLLRSCTGWPSGVWLDPPRRTVPDGSSFQLQHWTHEFDYALVAGDGDWRSLTLPALGQQYTTPLLARLAAVHPGNLPGTHSFLRVEPARRVLLSALKPAGNPIAHGSAAEAFPLERVTVRLAESSGGQVSATLDGALGLADLRAADLLEQDTGPGDGTLSGFQVATFTARPTATPVDAGQAPLLGPAGEPAQPVFARYWLHNRGPAPMGYLPVTVAVTPGLLTTDGAPVTVEVTLASQLRDADHEGVLRLIVPDGWVAEPASRVYRLPAGGHVRFSATVTPAAGAADGLYFVAARLEYGGSEVEDVASIAVGAPTGVLPAPAAQRLGGEALTDANGTTADAVARDTGLTVGILKSELVLRAGEHDVISVDLTNTTRDQIRGEVRLVSPWGSWEALPDTVRVVALPPGEHTRVEFPVRVPAGSAPAHTWAIAKVLWFGRCQYTPTIHLVVRQ